MISGLLLKGHLQNNLCKNAIITDAQYNECAHDDIKRLYKGFLNWQAGEDKLDYVERENDCDDYAVRFYAYCKSLGFAVGVVVSRAHACNFYATKFNEIYYFEPQTGGATTMIEPEMMLI